MIRRPPRSPLFPSTPLFRSLLALIPSANTIGPSGEGRYVGSATAPVDIDQWTGDVRHNISKDRKSTRLNSSHLVISYAVFCLKKKKRPANGPCVRSTLQSRA